MPPQTVDVALIGLVVVLGGMTLVWVASLASRNVAIVDIFWGPGFVVLAWLYRALLDVPPSTRAALVPVLVTLWGTRLAAHIAWRSRGKEEDYRYAAMREKCGDAFRWKSLYVVFWLQAVLLWIVAAPLLQVQRVAEPQDLTWLDWVGVVVFTVGLLFETIGDLQLSRFKSDPRNAGRVMDRGLWRYTRHPNYFGDAMVWWGLSLIALATPGSLWILSGTALMTLLLVRVSGVALLEKGMSERRPGYREYRERTSAFLPWFPGDPTESRPGSR